MKKIAIIILAISAFATLALGCKLFLINQEKEKWEAKLTVSRIVSKASSNALDYVIKRDKEIWNKEVQRLIELNNLETNLTTREKKEILELAQFLQKEYPELNIEIGVSSGRVMDLGKVLTQLESLQQKRLKEQGEAAVADAKKHAANIFESGFAELAAEEAFFNHDNVVIMLYITGSITALLLIAVMAYFGASLYHNSNTPKNTGV